VIGCPGNAILVQARIGVDLGRLSSAADCYKMGQTLWNRGGTGNAIWVVWKFDHLRHDTGVGRQGFDLQLERRFGARPSLRAKQNRLNRLSQKFSTLRLCSHTYLKKQKWREKAWNSVKQLASLSRFSLHSLPWANSWKRTKTGVNEIVPKKFQVTAKG